MFQLACRQQQACPRIGTWNPMAFIHQRKPRICVLTYKALTRLLRHAESRVRDRAEIIVDEYTLEDAVLRGRQMQQRGDIDVLVSATGFAGRQHRGHRL